METFQRMPWAGVAPTGGWVLGGATQTLNVTTGGVVNAEQTFTVDWRITNILTNLRQIEVRVTWAEPSDPPGWPLRRTALTSQRYGP